MIRKNITKSIPEKILQVGNFLNSWRTAEEIKKELKDSFGYNISITEIRKSLLRLLRRKLIQRVHDGKIYKYRTKGRENKE